jgi:hypothetical protein
VRAWRPIKNWEAKRLALHKPPPLSRIPERNARENLFTYKKKVGSNITFFLGLWRKPFAKNWETIALVLSLWRKPFAKNWETIALSLAMWRNPFRKIPGKNTFFLRLWCKLLRKNWETIRVFPGL